jgi:alpha-galactosidase
VKQKFPALFLALFTGSFLIPALAGSAMAQTQADLRGENPPAGGIWLETMDLSKMQQDWNAPHAGKSVENRPIRLDGVTFVHGIGTHAISEVYIDLQHAATRFCAVVGVDDEKKGHGTVQFHVIVDGKEAAASKVLHGGNAPQLLSVDLTGGSMLHLVADDAGQGIDSAHADWAGATLILKADASDKPRMVDAPPEPAIAIAPLNNTDPAIHQPRITGATPGKPFLFLIPATGQAPLSFSATNLPAGLTLDEKTGIISGSLTSAGSTDVQLTVNSPAGKASATLTIVGGDHKLGLTPPMGWNSWNVWAGHVDADKIRAAADVMISSGLAAHGFQYINIDDTWEGSRASDGTLRVNDKFKDMHALADYVHSKGLKLGIYSSPGPKTCAGFEGSFNHEKQDAITYGEWGVDYLKYDWCSCQSHDLKAPYALMKSSLDESSRDIFYSLCQYGMGDVWKWGGTPEIGGNCWRTTGDINDSWGSLKSIGFSQNGHEKYAGPGHWNDPDMLVVGVLGWGSTHPTHLKPNEQITHISLWSLLSAPLLIGCDMTRLDAFTANLLGNDEVLAIDQDPLGKPAGRVSMDGGGQVWARPLSDGSMAVGLFNTGDSPVPVTAKWSDLGLTGEQPIRDLWQRHDLPPTSDAFTATVPRHGAILVKIGKAK